MKRSLKQRALGTVWFVSSAHFSYRFHSSTPPLIYPAILLHIYPHINLLVHRSTHHQFKRLILLSTVFSHLAIIHLPINPSVWSFSHLSHPSIHPLSYQATHLSISSLITECFLPSICPPINLSTHRLSIYPFISSIHLSINHGFIYP